MTADGLTVGYALIGFDRSIVETAKQQTIRTVSLATLLFVLIGSLASIILGKRLTRPIHQMVKTSRAISAGNYNHRFMQKRNDELGDLMQAMNDMTEAWHRRNVWNRRSRRVALVARVLEILPSPAVEVWPVSCLPTFVHCLVGKAPLMKSIPH
jgi:HAMP domain-containing protein